jgi:hypothetical protein
VQLLLGHTVDRRPSLVDEDQADGIRGRLAANKNSPPLLTSGRSRPAAWRLFFSQARKPDTDTAPAGTARISRKVRSGCWANSSANPIGCSGKRERRSPPIARKSPEYGAATSFPNDMLPDDCHQSAPRLKPFFFSNQPVRKPL